VVLLPLFGFIYFLFIFFPTGVFFVAARAECKSQAHVTRI